MSSTSTAAAERPIAKREGESARPAGPASAVVRIEGLESRDGYGVWIEVDLPVRLHDSDVDRRAFAERFLRYSSIGTAGQVAEYLKPQLEKPLTAAVGEQPVSAVMEGAARGALGEAARRAAGKPLFAVGLMLDGEPRIRAGSPEWELRRVEEAAEAARVAAAEREGELLRRFEDIRRENPSVPAGALLMGLPAAERADALRALLKAAGQRKRSRLFAVAGDLLCEIDPADDEVTPLSLSGELGPLRSIEAIQRQGKPMLLVGARDGVFLLDPDAPDSAEAFDADVEGSPFGFSNLAYDESLDMIYATHADVGLVAWQVALGTRTIYDKDDFGGAAPRQIDARGGVAHVAAGDALYRCEANTPPKRLGAGESGAARLVAFLAGNDRELLLLWQSGAVLAVARGEGGEHAGPVKFPAAPAVAAAMPWLEDVRLLCAGEDAASGLILLAAHDTVLTPYASERGGPYKALAAAADCIAAVTADRHRLLCWHPWEERPFADLHVISRTRSRLADVTLM